MSFSGEAEHPEAVMPCQKGRPPFPMERRPNSLVCAWFNPSTSGKKEGRSVWLEAPWGHGLEVLGCCLLGHLRRCKWSVDWRGGPLRAHQRTNPGHCGDCWSRGQKVSLLLRSAGVECRPSWAPPISMPLVLYLRGTKSSALRRIAFKAESADCDGGVPAASSGLFC